MAWIDFCVCLFLGVLGVHKFREKKTGMGILYLLTGGLLGIGWLYDCVKYFNTAIKSENGGTAVVTSADEKSDTNSSDLPQPKKFDTVKRIAIWVLTGYLVLMALAFMPSVTSLFALLAAVLSAPVEVWQKILGKFVNGKIKVISIVALIILALGTVPTTEVSNADIPPSTTIATTEDTSEITQENTMGEQSTVEETTEVPVTLTTEPTTEPETNPTTEPITEPKTNPITEPATEPKTNPATNPVTEPETNPTTEPVTSAEAEECDYILNTSTMKFHEPGCRDVGKMDEENKSYFRGTREEVIAMGYSPCGHCDP